MATDSKVIAGIYDVQNIQPRLRKYAQDRDFFRFWVLRQLNTISLLKIISEKFGTVPASDIRDWKFRYPEFDELEYSFSLVEASSSTDATNTVLKVTNNIGAILNTSMRLTVDGIFCKKVVAAHTDMATAVNIASGIVLRESLRIINVGMPDSGGSGNTLVKVKRAHPADTYTGTAPAITTGMTLTITNVAVKANSFPQPPVTKNSKHLENLIQITRWSYGLGEMMVQGNGIDTFLAEGTVEHMNISYTIAETFLMKIIERAVITSRFSEKDLSGDLEHETGGILEFILSDTDHIIDLDGQLPTVQRMNHIIRKMADVAGVKELWMFLGTIAAEALANQYDNKVIWQTNGQLSLHYQMKIITLEGVGRDVVVHIVTAPLLNELGMGNEALVLNLTEYNYNEKSKYGSFQIAYKVPFDDRPKEPEGYKAGEGYMGRWRELYGAWGLVRRLPETHFRIINFPIPNY